MNNRTMAVAWDQTYGRVVRSLLLELDPGLEVEIVNRARRFFSIREVLAEATDHLYFFEPDVVILHVGIVDLWPREELQWKSRTPPDEFLDSCRQLASIVAQQPQTKLIILGVCPSSAKMYGRYPGLQELIATYNHILLDQADANQIFYIHPLEFMSDQNLGAHLLPDDQHLNVEGHRGFARAIAARIGAFLEHDKARVALRSAASANAHTLLKQSSAHYPYYIPNLNELLRLSSEHGEIESMIRYTSLLAGSSIHYLQAR